MANKEKPAKLIQPRNATERTLDRLAFWYKVYAVVIVAFSTLYLAAAVALILGSASITVGANGLFALLNLLSFVCMALYAGINVKCAQALKTRRDIRFVTYISGVNSILFPLGSILGVSTYRAVCRPEVEQLFLQAATGAEVDKENIGGTADAAPHPLPFHEAIAYVDEQEEELWKQLEARHRQQHHDEGNL